MFICYFGDTLGAGEGMQEAARASEMCMGFKELSPILTVLGASYHFVHAQDHSDFSILFLLMGLVGSGVFTPWPNRPWPPFGKKNFFSP